MCESLKTTKKSVDILKIILHEIALARFVQMCSRPRTPEQR